MTTTARFARTVDYDRPKPLTDFLDEAGSPLPGHELGKLILPPLALDAYAKSLSAGIPCEVVVTGEEWMPDGRHYLRFGTSRDYIEATTDYRHEETGLRYVCPECAERSGKHRKVCSRG